MEEKEKDAQPAKAEPQTFESVKGKRDNTDTFTDASTRPDIMLQW